MIGYEARCTKCGEHFNPADETDLLHTTRVDGTECGGQGELLGGWDHPIHPEYMRRHREHVAETEASFAQFNAALEAAGMTFEIPPLEEN